MVGPVSKLAPASADFLASIMSFYMPSRAPKGSFTVSIPDAGPGKEIFRGGGVRGLSCCLETLWGSQVLGTSAYRALQRMGSHELDKS